MKISKSKLWTILLIVAVVVPTFNNFELTFATWTLLFVTSLRNLYSEEIIKFSSILGLTIIIALCSGFIFYDYPIYRVFRDFTYLIKPILGLLIGYQIIRNCKLNPFPIIIYGSLALAFIHYVKILYGYFFLHMVSLNEIRGLAGYFSDFEVYGMVILIFSKNFNYDLRPRKKIIYLAIITISVLFYFSRTNFIQLGILVIALLGYFRLTKRALYVIGLLIISTFIGYWAIYYSNPRRNGPGAEAFLYKVKIAPIEAFKTRIDRNDWKDFNDNYRSFENIITIQQVGDEGKGAVLIGKGLGSRIDLGRVIITNDQEEVRYIPILHNSYMTIYLKAGLIGVLLMIVFLFLLLKQNKTEDKLIININYLLVGTGVFLIFSNWVFLGLYFKVDNKALIIGSLIAFRELIRKNQAVKEL